MADKPRVRIDPVSHAAWIDGQPVHLPPLQFRLLAFLAARPGQLVTRDEIMRQVWRTEWFPSTKTVDMHVSMLRRQVGDDGKDPTIILTVRGVGLRLTPGTVEVAGRARHLTAEARHLCEQALAGVASGWVPAEVGAFATTVLAALEAADD
ncbi:winged helix-turn-helix domain-containing protein [Nonomuraea sp. NPDC023979]|uniref:winged helix-turn-helix domain-containing protein n=1 Tax=Nonomuraea sp. NPDC023979 TaxID=3154796 RepID=UPI0033DD7976